LVVSVVCCRRTLTDGKSAMTPGRPDGGRGSALMPVIVNVRYRVFFLIGVEREHSIRYLRDASG